MPSSSMRTAAGRIVRNEGHGEIFYRLEVALPEPVEFVPGQFAMVSGWPGNDPLLPRPLAIFRSAAGPKGKSSVEFVYKVVGRGTALLSGFCLCSLQPQNLLVIILGRSIMTCLNIT